MRERNAEHCGSACLAKIKEPSGFKPVQRKKNLNSVQYTAVIAGAVMKVKREHKREKIETAKIVFRGQSLS